MTAMSGRADVTPVFPKSGWTGGWHVVPYEIPWRDCDAAGHVNNAIYFSYFEWGRTKYWLDMLGGSGIGDIGFIVARAECDFRQQLSMGERIEIRSRIGELRGRSLDFLTEIRTAGGQVAATGKVVVVLFDWEKQAKLPINDEMRRRVREFQGE